MKPKNRQRCKRSIWTYSVLANCQAFMLVGLLCVTLPIKTRYNEEVTVFCWRAVLCVTLLHFAARAIIKRKLFKTRISLEHFFPVNFQAHKKGTKKSHSISGFRKYSENVQKMFRRRFSTSCIDPDWNIGAFCFIDHKCGFWFDSRSCKYAKSESGFLCSRGRVGGRPTPECKKRYYF